VFGVDWSKTNSTARGLKAAHEKAPRMTRGKNQKGSRTKAKKAVDVSMRVRVKSIILHLPSLREMALEGTRVNMETMEGTAINSPSWTGSAPTSTKYRGRNAPVTAGPRMKKNETKMTLINILEP
jgi:hypothetical protein